MWEKITGWFSASIIPSWVPYAIVLAIGAGGSWMVQGWRYNATIAKMEKDNAESVLAFQTAARAKESQWNKQLSEAQDAHAKREISLRADADRARTAAGGLRNQLAEIRRKLPDLAADASRNRADALADILGQCVGKYQSLAETTDRINNDRQTLISAWPK